MNSLSSITNHSRFNPQISNVSSTPTSNLSIWLKFASGDITSTTIKNYGTYNSRGDCTIGGTGTLTLTNENGKDVGTFSLTKVFITLPSFAIQPISYTIMFYIKPNASTVDYVNFLVMEYNTYTDAVIFETQKADTRLLISVGGGLKNVTDNSINYQSGNTWKHICLVWNYTSTNSNGSLYIDGVFKAQYNAQATNYTNSRTNSIGRTTWDANQKFVGSMRNFRLYENKALTPEEILTCYQND